MKKELIINPKVKFCNDCGEKTKASFLGDFDSNTGARRLELLCINPKCYMGELSLGVIEQSSCVHEMRLTWFLIFPDKMRCRKCGFGGGDLSYP